MTWIRTVALRDSEAVQAAVAAQLALYPGEYTEARAAGDGGAAGDDLPGIIASHTLIPDALRHAFATFGVLMSPVLPLSRRHHEMIATTVSVANRCQY